MKYVNKELLGLIAKGTIPFVLAGGICGAIYTYERQEQLAEVPYKIEETFNYKNGTYKIFEVGEHEIIISRNDRIFDTKTIEGYMIKEVRKDNYFIYDNLKIIYVNTELVVVKASRINDDIVYFDEFGNPQRKKKLTKIK